MRFRVHVDLDDGSYVSWVEDIEEQVSRFREERRAEFRKELEDRWSAIVGTYSQEQVDDPDSGIYGELEGGFQTDFHVLQNLDPKRDIVGGRIERVDDDEAALDSLERELENTKAEKANALIQYEDVRKHWAETGRQLSAARKVVEAAKKMPDAGLKEGDPRYEWWWREMSPALFRWDEVTK